MEVTVKAALGTTKYFAEVIAAENKIMIKIKF